MNAADQRPAKRIALSGILAACSLLTLFLATILPTNRIFFYGLSSLFGSLIIIEYGIRAGNIFYLATVFLALILIPNKVRLIPYILILGHYPMWKTYFERQKSRTREVLLKLLVLNLGSFLSYYLVTRLFFQSIKLPFHFTLAFFGLQILFLVYDFAFTLFIRFYLDKIKPLINQL